MAIGGHGELEALCRARVAAAPAEPCTALLLEAAAAELADAGRELEAVVIHKTGDGAELLTGNFIGVRVPACPAPERERVRVAIRRVLPRRTEGEVIAP